MLEIQNHLLFNDKAENQLFNEKHHQMISKRLEKLKCNRTID